ncbi:MAG TPA: zinc-binding dehydrogenase [Acidimicrobiales bacterium]|nr:zinc-binding dehydrogenase [Acidimicrobiales bacterium]
MKALVLENGELTLQIRPDPRAGAGEVVVAVAAAGVNAADLLQRQGVYPPPPGWPVDVPGLELAGVVEEIGDGVDASLLGRRVCAVVGGGAQATRCVVPAAHLIAVPDTVDWTQAGALAEAVLTAHDALVSQAHLQRGERVVISGAAGGVGVAAVQIAHSLGAHVIAVTRDPSHHEELTGLGADETVTIDDVRDLAPVDVVLELVGAAHLERVLEVSAAFARLVVIGVGAGSKATIDLRLIMGRRLTLSGSTLRARSHDEKARVVEAASAWLADRWTRGEFVMPLAHRFDLDEAPLAYAAFAERGKFGKIVLTTDLA